MGKNLPYRRLIAVASFLLLLFIALIAQFYKIQIIEGEKWKQIASRQHQHLIKQPFVRGTIYSNPSLKQGHPERPQALALDIPKFHLYANPDAIPINRKKELAALLSKELDHKEQEAWLEKQLFKESKSRKLSSFLDPNEKERLSLWWKEYAKHKKLPSNAIYFLQDYKRCHPMGSLLGQVLHTVRDIRDSSSGEAFPTGGLELSLHRFLHGQAGKRISYRSPRNTLEMGPILQEARNGSDVYLTINHYIQAVVEQELEKGVLAAEAKGGWAIMMHPSTGEIFALAQYPFFHPDHYADYFNDEALSEHTKIKALTDLFEPGSIFKPIVATIALEASYEALLQREEPTFRPEEMLPTAKFSIKGSSYRLKDLRRHNFLNLYMGLQKSSNIYMGKIIEKMLEEKGDDWYQMMLKDRFALGEKSGVELPGETIGLIPRPGKLHPNGTLEWSLPTPYVIGIGHNVSFNSMQMIRAFSMIINGGFDVRPTLIKKIVSPEGELIYKPVPKKKKRVFHSEVCQEISKALKYVTKPGGSGRRADVQGYTEGGKSGTSEKLIQGRYSNKDFISSFIGFAPAKDPEFVLLIVIDEPVAKYMPGRGRNNQGGACAAPIFREIAGKTLQYLGREPDDPLSLQGDHKNKDWIAEVKQLQELYNQWNQ